jgi:hypothetical protein
MMGNLMTSSKKLQTKKMAKTRIRKMAMGIKSEVSLVYYHMFSHTFKTYIDMIN